GHLDSAPSQVHARLLASAIQELRNELGETKSAPAGFSCLSAAPSAPNEAPPDIPGLLRRIDALLVAGGDVLLFSPARALPYDRPRESLYNGACALRRRPFPDHSGV